jgi:tetratricopeptide (TPR) repeat protein
MAPKTYKVRLNSGRVLGPLDLDRVRLLILKNQITGRESACIVPTGEWQNINSIPELGELLLAKAQGQLTAAALAATPPAYDPIRGMPIGNNGATVVLPLETIVLPVAPAEAKNDPPPLQEEEEEGKTVVDPGNTRKTLGIGQETMAVSALPLHKTISKKLPPEVPAPTQAEIEPQLEKSIQLESIEDEGKTYVGELDESERTVVHDPRREKKENNKDEVEESDEPVEPSIIKRKISSEPTVVFQRSAGSPKVVKGTKKASRKERVLGAIVAVLLAITVYPMLFPDQSKVLPKWEPIRPRLPAYVQGKTDSAKSQLYLAEGNKAYNLDTQPGYRAAANMYLNAASTDIGNVQALALLASSYLNLIDSSNKDESYFATVSKLIELSRAKALDLFETVVADVELYLALNKPEAAQNRIVEYSKTHPKFNIGMFYYLALTLYQRGDMPSAARYISQIDDKQVYSAKIYYLKGQIAEKLGDPNAALVEYGKAVKFNPSHALSRLRISEILVAQGKIKEAASHLEFLTFHNSLMPPRQLGEAFYLHSKLAQAVGKDDIGLGDIKRAVRLDRENHDYLLEMYTLQAKVTGSIKQYQKEARMYFFLSQGEKLTKEGKYQDALVQFLAARQANDKSPVPSVKIGDMFSHLHNISDARLNYQVAAEHARSDVEIWSKYINSLIQSYEWEEAKRAITRFRAMPVNQSAIDRSEGDFYEKQGEHLQAQEYYKRAMSRELIDSEVYISYAKSLISTKNYREAPYFFSLALRFDPLNIDAISGIARCIAETDSVDRAITMLQDELQKEGGSRPELLVEIANLMTQKGSWDLAQSNIDQAIAADPDYPNSYKVQALIYLNLENTDKKAIDRAIASFQSYSDRNPSDPSGYLEEYRLYAKKGEYDKAGEELEKIYTIYPKYPNLHMYKGILYSVQQNHKAAADELKLELANNPQNYSAMVEYGKELLLLGDPTEALRYFNSAMKRAPTSAEAKAQAGYANYLLKNFAGAVALYNASLVYDKANPLVYKRLGLAYRDLGDGPKAAEAFRKYLEMEPDAPDKAEFQGYR